MEVQMTKVFMEVLFIVSSLLLSSTTGIQRPLSPEETQALQGLAPTFDSPPKGWSTPNADRTQDQTFDYNGVGLYGAASSQIKKVVESSCEIEASLADAGKDAKEQCYRSFCHPLCTKLTWDCTFAVGKTDLISFTKFVEMDAYREALCAQIKAHACVEIAKVCPPGDPFLYNWVDDMTTDSDSLGSLVPYPECEHDPENEDFVTGICSECSKAFKLTITIPENLCDNLGSIPGGVPDSSESIGGNWVQNTNRKDNTYKKLPQLPKWVPELADGKRTSLRERCEYFQTAFQIDVKAKAEEFFNARKICECLGCCDVPEGDPPVCWVSK